MSQQFVFWRTEASLDSADVYERLMQGDDVDGLEPIDPDAAEAALVAAFPDWAVEVRRADVPEQTMLGFEDTMGIDVGYRAQCVTVTCYGMGESEWNVVIGTMADLGYPLYDPQISYRFD